MTVSTIASLAAGLNRTLNNQNARVSASLQTLASASRLISASVDVSSLAISNDLQSQLAALRMQAQNIAQARALTDVANGGASKITDGLARLQQLASQAASGTISDSERQALNAEFQSVRETMDGIAKNTRFAEQNLLNGALAVAEGNPGLAIGDFTDQALFKGADVNILTAQNAAAALNAVSVAQKYVASQLSSIGTLGEDLQFAAGSILSAIQNQEAARSTLSDTDLASASTESASARVQAQAAAALLAQTNRLAPSALQLLVE